MPGDLEIGHWSQGGHELYYLRRFVTSKVLAHEGSKAISRQLRPSLWLNVSAERLSELIVAVTTVPATVRHIEEAGRLKPASAQVTSL
jgi:hypothetical protein